MFKLWSIQHHHPSESHLHGRIMGQSGMPFLFRTRREAREFIKEHYGYIKTREDLRYLGWRMPRPVKVTVVKRGGQYDK